MLVSGMEHAKHRGDDRLVHRRSPRRPAALGERTRASTSFSGGAVRRAGSTNTALGGDRACRPGGERARSVGGARLVQPPLREGRFGYEGLGSLHLHLERQLGERREAGEHLGVTSKELAVGVQLLARHRAR